MVNRIVVNRMVNRTFNRNALLKDAKRRGRMIDRGRFMLNRFLMKEDKEGRQGSVQLARTWD